ncbi:MAG: CU044_2847 family protein [Acidimicrobiales bacterium]
MKVQQCEVEGVQVLFEVVEAAVAVAPGASEVLAGDGALEQAAEKVVADFGGVTTQISAVVGSVASALSGLEVEKVEVELGLTLGAEVGWFVGKATGEASIVVRCTVKSQ